MVLSLSCASSVATPFLQRQISRLRNGIVTVQFPDGSLLQLLLGGVRFGGPLVGLLLESFWKMHRVAHGDHWVFQQHGECLRQCVPYYLHLDEGTGLRKSAVLVINMQACWGQGTADAFEKLHASGLGRTDADMEDCMLTAEFHNQTWIILRVPVSLHPDPQENVR